MSLLSILRTVWRHKLWSLPVIVLTVAGVVYAAFLTPPYYEARSTYAFVNPPSAPTAAEVAKNPALGEINAENPYLRFNDQTVVVELLIRRINSDRTRGSLEAAGADPRYDVIASRRFGSTTPLAEVLGVGDSAEEALRTERLVAQALEADLAAIQAAEQVDPRYAITPLVVDAPEDAHRRLARQFRTIVAITALGGLLLLALVSVAQAIEQSRGGRAVPVTPAGAGGGGMAGPASEPQGGDGVGVEGGRYRPRRPDGRGPGLAFGNRPPLIPGSLPQLPSAEDQPSEPSTNGRHHRGVAGELPPPDETTRRQAQRLRERVVARQNEVAGRHASPNNRGSARADVRSRRH